MVGISLDGPREIHDRYRRDRKGNGTFDAVMHGLGLLRKHGVEYNVLACVARDTARVPLKETALPRWCRQCDVLAACRGGCPKHRFATTCYDEPGLHYLCEGYRKFFLHIRKYRHAMAQLLENGLPASRIMDAFKDPLVIKRQTTKK